MRVAFASLLLLSLATTFGCSSEPPAPAVEESSPPAATAGAETTPEPPAAPEPAPVAEEPIVAATGPGPLVLTATIAGKSVPAVVHVLDASGEKRAEVKAGEPVNLPAGNYDLEVAITDAAVMADRPTQKRELVLQAGQNAQVEA